VKRQAALILLAGCTPAKLELRRNEGALIGLAADELRLCAGVPDRTQRSEAGEFWTYDRSPPGTGVSLPVPVVGGAANVSRATDCRVTFLLVEGRVARVAHNAQGGSLASDSACAPVVRGGLREP
jgi:hypothetical protein